MFARGSSVSWESAVRSLPRLMAMRLDGMWLAARYNDRGCREAQAWGTTMGAALSGATYAPTERI